MSLARARYPCYFYAVLSVLLVGLIFSLNLIFEFEISLLYMFPIFFLNWFCYKHKHYNICFSVICSILWTLTDSVYFIPNLLIRSFIFISFSFIVIKLRKLLEEQNINSLTDNLTNLYNSRGLSQKLSYEITRYNRYHNPFSIAYIDLDNFKSVNDNFGHDTGDNLLKTIGLTIKSSIRISDFSSRIGGDEFVIVFLETKNEDDIRNLIENLKNKLNTEISKYNFKITASVGVLSINWPYSIKNSEELLKLADKEMYKAKRDGKDSIKFTSI